jgi:hypothetical protein
MKKKAGRSRRGRRLRGGKVDAVAPGASTAAEEQPAPSSRPTAQPGKLSSIEGSSEGPATVVWVIVGLVVAFITIITWLISLGYGPAAR